jgi:hypothetical protein
MQAHAIALFPTPCPFSWQALHEYKVRATTGTLTGAGYDGRAFVTLHGWWGTVAESTLAAEGETNAHLKACCHYPWVGARTVPSSFIC